VGGEGNCPAPVDAVQSRVIVSGNHSVETDRVATRLMGFDPAQIALMRIADENGFNDPKVEVFGEEKVTPYRPADPSLIGKWMQEYFPNVRVLIGHSKNNAPVASGQENFSNEQLCALENVCRGGCQATTRYAFDMLYHEGQKRTFSLTLIIGAGVNHADGVLYYDALGKAYTRDAIAALKGKKVAIGTCTSHLKGIVDRQVEGCMPLPNSPHMIIHQMSGSMCSVMTPRNRSLVPLLFATLRVCEKRKAILRKGIRIDIPLHHEDKHYRVRAFSEAEKQLDYIYEPYEPLSKEESRELCAAENRSILATFLP